VHSSPIQQLLTTQEDDSQRENEHFRTVCLQVPIAQGLEGLHWLYNSQPSSTGQSESFTKRLLLKRRDSDRWLLNDITSDTALKRNSRERAPKQAIVVEERFVIVGDSL